MRLENLGSRYISRALAKLIAVVGTRIGFLASCGEDCPSRHAPGQVHVGTIA